jgi:heme/copper-type cytochrome/quinol oxidase subunit 4
MASNDLNFFQIIITIILIIGSLFILYNSFKFGQYIENHIYLNFN